MASVIKYLGALVVSNHSNALPIGWDVKLSIAQLQRPALREDLTSREQQITTNKKFVIDQYDRSRSDTT
jgi:hypothetical protein